jgi:hypothetical protein
MAYPHSQQMNAYRAGEETGGIVIVDGIGGFWQLEAVCVTMQASKKPTTISTGQLLTFSVTVAMAIPSTIMEQAIPASEKRHHLPAG